MTPTLTAADNKSIDYQIALCDKIKDHLEKQQSAKKNLDEWLYIKTNWKRYAYGASFIENKIHAYQMLMNIHRNQANKLINKLKL